PPLLSEKVISYILYEMAASFNRKMVNFSGTVKNRYRKEKKFKKRRPEDLLQVARDYAAGRVSLFVCFQINLQKAATYAWLFAPLKGPVCAKGVHAAPCKNSEKWLEPLFRYTKR